MRGGAAPGGSARALPRVPDQKFRHERPADDRRDVVGDPHPGIAAGRFDCGVARALASRRMEGALRRRSPLGRRERE